MIWRRSSLYCLGFLGLFLFSCSNASVKGDGFVCSFTKPISYYQTLKLDGSFSVKLVQQEFPMLEARTHANLKSNLAISLEKGVLTIRDKKKVTEKKLHHITLGFNDLSRLELSGQIKLDGNWEKKIPKMDIQLKDKTIANIRLNVVKLNVKMDDFSKLQVIGTNQKLKLETNDKAIFDGFRLENYYATIGLSHRSKALLYTQKKLKGTIEDYSVFKSRFDVQHKELEIEKTASVEIIGR